MLGRTEKKKYSGNNSEVLVCDVCGQNHCTESCLFISNNPSSVKDAVTPSHARLTLPANLMVKDLSDGTTTVITQAKFERGTRFGPFIAPQTSILPPEIIFPLKVFGKSDEDSYYLDTRNENYCNWMCLVPPVSSSCEVQNLFCYQVHNKIYFSLVRDVEIAEELRVWYAPFYGVKMGLPLGKISSNLTEISIGVETAQKKDERVTWEADTTTTDLVPPEYMSQCSGSEQIGRKKTFQKKEIQNKKILDDKAGVEYVAKRLPPKRLGARFTPSCWRCRECGAKEESVITYARHLMQHLKSESLRQQNFPCSLCHKKFFTQKLLDEHEKTRHGMSEHPSPLECPENKEVKSCGVVDPSSTERYGGKKIQINFMVNGSSCVNFQKSIESYAESEKNSCSQNTLNDTCVIKTNNSTSHSIMEESLTSALVDTTQQHSTTSNINFIGSDSASKKSTTLMQGNLEKSEEVVCKMPAISSECAVSNVMGCHGVESLSPQNFQQPSVNKPGVPGTILNHEFFTRVTGDNIVQDVKSLLSLGYSLQFLVENEDGSSSLVDVLSTGNNAGVHQVSPNMLSISQGLQNSSQQLVIMANGNVFESLPLALQNILPSSVPIAPCVSDSLVTSQSSLVDPSVSDVTLDCRKKDVQLSSCLSSEAAFLNQPDQTSDSNSPLGTMLPTSLVNNMCFDTVIPFHESSSVNASLMDMSINAENLEREDLDYELSSLELPLAVNDSTNTDYIINSCTTPSPHISETNNLCAEKGTELNTPVKLLDQCMDVPLPTDVMDFDFGAHSQESLPHILNNSQTILKSTSCREELSKEFSDLIAADTDSSNMLLSIQPADSTAELNTHCNNSLKGLISISKAKSNPSLEWGMGREALLLPPSEENINNSRATLPNAEGSTSKSSTLDDQNVTLLKGSNIPESELEATEIKAHLDGLLMETHSNLCKRACNLQSQIQINENQINSQSPSQLQSEIHSRIISQNQDEQWASENTTVSASTQQSTQIEFESEPPCPGHPIAVTQSKNEIQTESQSKSETFTCTHNHQSHADQLQDCNVSNDSDSILETNELEPSMLSAGPPFICDICNKSFGKVAYLYRHLRKHTGEFTCVACHAVFARKESLQLHECAARPIQVSGRECLSCPFCAKKFVAKKQLTRHLANHAGTHRFQCPMCNCSFSSKEAAELHAQKCTKKTPVVELSSEQITQNTTTLTSSRQAGQPMRCDICRRMFLSRSGLQRHKVSEHKDSSPHQCSYCGRFMALASPKRLEQHVRVCAPAASLQAGNADAAVCPYCNEPFRQLLLYRQHIFRHTHPYSCAHCQRSFPSLEDRGKHVCLDRLEQCAVCGLRLGTVAQLEKHALTHGVPNYHCFECGHSFHSVNNFNQHRCFELNLKISRRTQKNIANSDYSTAATADSSTLSPASNIKKALCSDECFMCEICGDVFKSKRVLKSHLRSHGEPKMECNVCGKRFHRKDVLVEHMYVHEEPQLHCPICNKLLKSKKSLDVHVRQQHSGQKEFICQQCGKGFYQKVNLRKHMRSHEPRPDPVSCPHCGRRFRFQEALAKHIAEHLEEPRFNCNQCNQSFIKEKLLRQHMKVHVLRGYSCPACGHSLKHRHSLRRHIVKHHSELTQEKGVISSKIHEVAIPDNGQSQGPEVLLTVSQLQLTTDGVQPICLPEDIGVGNSTLLGQGSVECSENMVLYVLQEPLSSLPHQEPST